MKENQKSQEEINKEIARKQWDSWIVDLQEDKKETQFDEYGNSENGDGDS